MKNADSVEEVRRGSCVVKIYATPSKGRELYTLSYWLNGKRCRPTFAKHDKARKEAERVATNMAKGELAVLTLRDHDRLAYVRAVEALRPTGVPLELAAIQFAEAWKLLNGAPLIDAIKNQVAENPRAIQPKLVRQVVDELLERKQQGGWSKLYLTDLRLRLGRFADAFKCPISSIQTQEITGFLDSLKVAARTRNNFRRAIGTLFNYAKTRSYVSRSHPGVTEVEKAKAGAVSIGIFTVEEVEKLLNACPRELLPALAIGAFAGLRAEEIKRLHWSEVRLDRRHIEVTNEKAKTGGRRLVPISANLLAWLRPYAGSEGAVVPVSNLWNQFKKVAAAAGVEWERNGLRHSYISYRVAKTGDVHRTALEAGNSAKMIHAHYLEAVPKAQGTKWFQIAPAGTTGEIELVNAA